MPKRKTKEKRMGVEEYGSREERAASYTPPRPYSHTVIVLLYLALATLYVARVPMWTQPDEGVHLGYVRYLVQHRKFPIFEGNKEGQLYEAHQPPLYYLLCAPAYLLTGAHRVEEREIIVAYVCRGVSALCGLGIVLLVGVVARSLFPSDKLLSLVTMGFAALLPMHLHVGASIGNDALAGLLCAATMAWMVQRLSVPPLERFSVGQEVAVAGALTGLALLSKSSCLFLLPMVAVFYFLRGRENASTHHALRPAALACIVALLVVSPWWIRNQILYGDPLAAKAFLKGFDNPGPDYFLVKRMNLPVFDYAVKLTLALTFMTFWGIFGEVNNAYQHYTQAVFGADPHGEKGTFYGFFVLCLLFAIASLIGCFKGFRAASSRSAFLLLLAVAAALAGWFAALQAIAAETTTPLTMILFALSALLALTGWMTSTQHATRNTQYASRNTQYASRNTPHASRLTPHALLAVGILLIFLQFLQFNIHYFQAQARYLHPMLIGIAPLFIWGLDSMLPKKTRPVWISLLGVLLLALSVMNLTVWRTPTP